MTIACNDTPVPARAPRTGIIATINGYLTLLARSIAAANAYDTLDQLSDRELARRGLERGDIAKVAMKVLSDES